MSILLEEVRFGAPVPSRCIVVLLRASPGKSVPHSALGLTVAGLGRHDEAIRAGRKGVELLPLAKVAIDGTGPLLALAEVFATGDESDGACGQREALRSVPNGLSAPVFRPNARWAPLPS